MKPLITEQDFAAAAKILGCNVATIKAVAEVEAPRGGFNPDDTPVTLFEGHKFSKFTQGQHDAAHPDLSYPRWTRNFYGKTWQQEQDRLQRAMALDREAALCSASWGKFQIMGFNYALAGFITAQKFVNAMYKSEGEQLLAFVQFCKSSGLQGALKARDWDTFAAGYNGPAYAENRYDEKLAGAYSKYSVDVA